MGSCHSHAIESSCNHVFQTCAPHASGQKKNRPPVQFGAFLKRPKEAQAPSRTAASFVSFLRKQPDQAQPGTAGEGARAGGADPITAAAAEAGPGLDRKPVTVLYGTEYGFSKEIAEKVGAQMKDGAEFWCVPCRSPASWCTCVICTPCISCMHRNSTAVSEIVGANTSTAGTDGLCASR